MEKTIKISSNEKKVRKKLEKFPHGVKVTTLERELHMSKTSIYETLNRLEIKELAFRGEHCLWYSNPPLGNESSKKSGKRFTFFKSWRLAGIEREKNENKKVEREILMRERESAAILEAMFLPKDLKGYDRINIANKIKKKYGFL